MIKESIKRGLAVGVAAVLAFWVYGCGTESNGSDDYSENMEIDAEPISDASSDPETASSNSEITIIRHPVSSKIDGTERANGAYPEIVLSEEIAGKFPKLKETIDYYNDVYKTATERDVAEYATWANEQDSEETVYTSEVGVEVVRADDRMFSVVTNFYDYSGGAHPNHGTGSFNIDPATGSIYTINQVLNDTTDFAKIVRDKMEENTPGIMEEVDSYHFGDGDVFEDKLTEDSYSWTLTDEGLHLYFSPYEIASYAAGYFDVIIGDDEYPNLIQDIFKVKEKQDIEKIVTKIDGDVIEVEPRAEEEEDAYYDEYVDGSITVVNTSWKPYCNSEEGRPDASFVSLTQIKEDKTDWLDTEVWAVKNGFELASLPYSDGSYRYEPYNPVNFSYMYNGLMIYDANSGELLYDYDLGAVCNGPDETEGLTSSTTQYVRWAQIVDHILYVSVGHNGYASEEPWSNYMVAIDLNSNDVLWRSAPLVSNASNFKIVGDTIICGYGFTQEPDYIYLLNRYTGDVVSSIPVNSAPAQFEVVDNTLYVATYNTAYEFSINR